MNTAFTVHTESLKNCALHLATGNFYIPMFQRDYVWDSTRQVACLDSLLRHEPLGAIYVIEARQNESQTAGYHVLAHKKEGGIPAAPRSAVIDGQQRLTTVSSMMFGRPDDNKNLVRLGIRIPCVDGAFDFSRARAVEFSKAWPKNESLHKLLESSERRNTSFALVVSGETFSVYSKDDKLNALRNKEKPSASLLPKEDVAFLVGPLFSDGVSRASIEDLFKHFEDQANEFSSEAKSQRSYLRGVIKGGGDQCAIEEARSALEKAEEALKVAWPLQELKSPLGSWLHWLGECAPESRLAVAPSYVGCVQPVMRLSGTGWTPQRILDFYEDLNSLGMPLKTLELTYAKFADKLPQTFALWSEEYKRQDWFLHMLHAAIFSTVHAEHAKKKYRKSSRRDLYLDDVAWRNALQNFSKLQLEGRPLFDYLRHPCRSRDKRFAAAIALLPALGVSVREDGGLNAPPGMDGISVFDLVRAMYLSLCLTDAGHRNEQELQLTQPELSDARSRPEAWEANKDNVVARLYLVLSKGKEELKGSSPSDYFSRPDKSYRGKGNYLEALCSGIGLGGSADERELHHIFPQKGHVCKSAIAMGLDGETFKQMLNAPANLIYSSANVNNVLLDDKSPAQYWPDLLTSHPLKSSTLTLMFLPRQWETVEGFKSWWEEQLGGEWGEITETFVKRTRNGGSKSFTRFCSEHVALQKLLEFRSPLLLEKAKYMLDKGVQAVQQFEGVASSSPQASDISAGAAQHGNS